ncbi:phage tail protein [Pasteurella multocida]|uniref:host specificity protein J n=1 Tax=Pasteurella multocida TaxID=747 RepID=UPI0009F69607|nr:phage tail protein [Pasteurella multocida]MEB3450958.1 phage tail protein [Pasteurella multocida]MEB3452629.1 phage tail protein [Pasteurella multocida]MEB3455135.1 phage tail protein [Pasteurella multocida]MEB3460229.1 phage tail protein [Pasteurella multocida]MEB3462365.1 phage tail protein [Pasteurella multocida]
MGGKKGGGGHTPYEAPESGRSKQFVKIVEIISEGEIQGLVDGVKSVYLDKTPIQASDDSYNFKNVDAQGRIGTQDQAIMEGFNTSEIEVSVGAQVRKLTPLTRTVTDNKVSRLRFTVGVQSLFSQNDKGDTYGSKVDLMITIGETSYPVSINGKYSSQYLKQFEFDDLPVVPFKIKVERVTADSTSQRLQNNTIWASYTEIIETEFAYPNTAIVGVRFDSEYFSSIPNRTYEIYGIKIKVPSNYDPVNRTYTGLWDGTFKIAWSNNPAWVLYDLMTNKRYGLGWRLGSFNVDKWTLYQVAQYCDQLVPDGFGGKEPRFTCNAWLTDQRKAYDVINDICSIFRAMPVWNGQEFTVVMDRPADPVWTYTNANVVDGEFTYQYSAQKARHNEIHVEYVDASDSYERKIEIVSDDDLIRRHGLNIKKVTAFGCTSRGQAFRTGKWILETERLETKTVTFTVGVEGLMHIPGDIIRIADCHYADTNIGGRVLAVNGRKVTLDREITPWDKSYLTYINQEAKHTDIRIVNVSGNEVTLESEPIGLTELGVWSLTTQEINVQLFKALMISEDKQGQYTIVALQHEPQKEAIVDNGAVFEPKETTLSTAGLDKVQHVEVQADGDGISLSFDYVVKHSAMVKYQIKLYKGGTFYKIYDDLTSPNYKLIGLPDGEYIAEIRAKNEQGQLSEAVTKSFNISFAVSELTTVSKVFGILLQWKNPVFANPNSAIEIWTSAENRFETARKLVTLAYPTNSYSFDGLGVNETHYFWVRMLDTANGNAGQFTESVVGVSESSGSKLVEYLQGQISSNAFSQELAEQITKIEKTGKSNAARMNSMHILKVEDHASGKKAIAGIAIGADAESDESQVIISANKFIIADPNSSTLKTPFSILTEDGSAKVVLDGDLIANGTISGDKIQANSTISAPNINGGNVKASTFEGGLIRGARIEGVTGTFTGDLEVNQIVGGNILEVFTCRSKRIGTVSAGSFGSNPRYYISYLRKRVRVLVESVNVDRDLFIIDALSSVSGRLYESTETRHRGGSDSDYITSITTYKPGTWNIQARIVIGDGVIDTYQQSISIPKNVECSIEITYETLSDTSTDSDSFTFISVVKSNASKSIKQVI